MNEHRIKKNPQLRTMIETLQKNLPEGVVCYVPKDAESPDSVEVVFRQGKKVLFDLKFTAPGVEISKGSRAGVFRVKAVIAKPKKEERDTQVGTVTE